MKLKDATTIGAPPLLCAAGLSPLSLPPPQAAKPSVAATATATTDAFRNQRTNPHSFVTRTDERTLAPPTDKRPHIGRKALEFPDFGMSPHQTG
ncbi:hypothetical protein Amsp01_070450 [Amycolatopsis sp. NBRC 101858]|nr:hypothetical protein Amsp01_070450 [Amycolatopsis sp. NBRC 101858]